MQQGLLSTWWEREDIEAPVMQFTIVKIILIPHNQFQVPYSSCKFFKDVKILSRMAL